MPWHRLTATLAAALSTPRARAWAAAGAAAAIFVLDVFTPHGVADFILYLIPLGMTAREGTRFSPFVVAGVCTGLSVAGFLLSPADVPLALAIENRSIGVVVLWVAAWTLDRQARTVAALRETEERFAIAFRKAPFASALSRLPDGLILEVNEAFETMFGRPARDVVGRTSRELDLYPADAQERMVAAFQSRGSLRDFELTFGATSGEQRVVLVNSDVVAIGGRQHILTTAEDITRRVRAEAALRDVSYELMKSEDTERRRIARELHDSTAQDVIAVAMGLDDLGRRLAGFDGEAARQLGDSVAVLERCAHDLRTLSYLLHPPLLDDEGLGRAIRHYARGFAERTGLAVTLELPEAPERPPQDVELTLFRVVQECLANIRRHANSPTAAIALTREAGALVLEVADAGSGIAPQILDGAGSGLFPGVGIPGMRERLRHIGGRLVIDSSTRGTTVRAVVPVNGR